MAAPKTAERTAPWMTVRSVFVFQAVGLLLAGWIYRDSLNPDGIAYMQIAAHFMQGRFDLAISGHWGPLLSWLMIPVRLAGIPALETARIVMVLSSIIFLSACVRLFRVVQIRGGMFYAGLWSMAAVSILWSVEIITPDLLVAGILLFACAEMLREDWPLRRATAFVGGLLWGLAFLAKAVALPLGILTSAGFAFLWWRKNPAARRQIARSLGLTLAGLTVAAIPWIATLSRHYGKLTVSHSATYNHVLVGPEVKQPLQLLDEGFQHPKPDQITIWEDPSAPDADWSPLESWANAAHQIKIILRNTPTVLLMLTSICLAFPIVLTLAVLRPQSFRPDPREAVNPAWCLWPVAAMALIYLPNYILLADQRYLYAVAPLLFVGAAGLLRRDAIFRAIWRQRLAPGLLAAALLVPALVRWTVYASQTSVAGEYALTLAQKITQAHLAGPIAGSGKLPGGRAGLYTAYFLSQPWLCDKSAPSAADFENSGAALIIVNRQSASARELAHDNSFRNLDGNLFSAEEAGQFPLQVFGRN